MRSLNREILPLVAPAILLILLLFIHVAALRSIAFAITVATALFVWRKHPGPTVPLKIPLFLWAALALLSLLWARSVAYSVSEIRVEVVYDIAFFLSFFALTRERLQWNVFRGALLAGLATLAIMAIGFFARTRDLNLNSILGGVMSISTHIVAVFPLLVATLFEFRGNTRARVIGGLVVIFVLTAGYLTFNRNFIVAIDAVVLTMVLAAIWLRRTDRKHTVTLGLVAAIWIAASGLFFMSVVQQRADEVKAPVESALKSDPRLGIWQFSVGLIHEQPFTGAGFGRFAAVDSYREKFPNDAANAHAHNPFLNYAVQMGIEGALLLAFLMFTVAREFSKLAKDLLPEVGLIGIAGLGMVVGVLVKTQTDDLWGRQHGYLFWALTGMMLGYAHRLRSKPIPADR
ncbi:MAG: O-antigen ligase family protein [Betaproteobacteria bacterium]